MGYGYPPQQGGYGYGGSQAYGPPPPNHLVWAILSTVLCCWMTGIVAIVFAAQVDSKYQAGDYHGALDASNKARIWSIVSVVTLLVVVLLYLLLVFGAGLAVLGAESATGSP